MNADISLGLPGSDEVDLAVELFRMLADGTRLQILWALRDGERSVGDLADVVNKRPASVSQHLAKLRLARVVHTRREGTTIHYRLENEHVRQLVVDVIHHAQHQSPGIPEHHRNDQVVALDQMPR